MQVIEYCIVCSLVDHTLVCEILQLSSPKKHPVFLCLEHNFCQILLLTIIWKRPLKTNHSQILFVLFTFWSSIYFAKVNYTSFIWLLIHKDLRYSIQIWHGCDSLLGSLAWILMLILSSNQNNLSTSWLCSVWCQNSVVNTST